MSQKIVVLFILFLLTFFNVSYSQIDYTELNPPIEILLPDSTGSNYHFIDMDGDGNTDLFFEMKLFYTLKYSAREVESYSSEVEGISLNEINVGPYLLNDNISSTLSFYSQDLIYAYMPEFGGNPTSWGHQLSSPDDIAYIGVKIIKNNNNYYGWVKLKTNGKKMVIYSYAISSSPNQSINAGQSN